MCFLLELVSKIVENKIQDAIVTQCVNETIQKEKKRGVNGDWDMIE